MMGRTAHLTGQVGWLYVAPAVAPGWGAALLGIPLVTLGAYLPDIEHAGSTAGKRAGKLASGAVRRLAGGHRGGTHSAVVLYAMYVLTGIFFYGVRWGFVALLVGWGAHIFTDLLTVRGVRLFWPLGWLGILGHLWKPLFAMRALNSKVRIASFTTGGTGEVIYCALVVVTGVMLAGSMVLPYLPGGAA